MISRHLFPFVAVVCLLFGAFCSGATYQVQATVETDPVHTSGDGADDTAIWLHPDTPGQSLIVGTDKGGGLIVYNLEGREIQWLGDGRMNNVDISYGFPHNGEIIDIALATNRTYDKVSVYKIDAATRQLSFISNVDVGVGMGPDLYGICMYRVAKTGKFIITISDKQGDIEQIELISSGATVSGLSIRVFNVLGDIGGDYITEGLVADEDYGFIYVCPENMGIYKFEAESTDTSPTMTVVDLIEAGGHLPDDDVEGLTMYKTSDWDGYLMVSVQGTSEFVMYERKGDNDYVGTFEIVANAAAGIDKVSFTDGIDVISSGMGSLFPNGFFVAQDDYNTPTPDYQNYKLVPWEDIATGITPGLIIDTTWDPRKYRYDFEDIRRLAQDWISTYDLKDFARVAKRWAP